MPYHSDYITRTLRSPVLAKHSFIQKIAKGTHHMWCEGMTQEEVLSACLNQEGLVLQHSPVAIRSAVTSLKWGKASDQGTSLTLLRRMVQLSLGRQVSGGMP